MTFTRYEIRWTYHRCFYEGGDDFEYMPFDTLSDAKAYVSKHKDTCKSDSNNDVTCGIYKVILHSNYDETEEIERL